MRAERALEKQIIEFLYDRINDMYDNKEFDLWRINDIYDLYDQLAFTDYVSQCQECFTIQLTDIASNANFYRDIANKYEWKFEVFNQKHHMMLYLYGADYIARYALESVIWDNVDSVYSDDEDTEDMTDDERTLRAIDEVASQLYNKYLA